MKHYILIFLCLFLSKVSYAQFDLTASSSTGYESNILRSPSRIIQDDELLESEDIYRNSIYQDVMVNLKYRREARQSVFRLSAKAQKRFFYSESESNRLIMDLKAKYRLDLGETSNWENEVQYFNKDQNGLDADQNELGTTFGYNVLNIDSKFNFRFYKNNRSYIGLHYGKKNFDPTEIREVSYNKYGITMGFKNVTWHNHLLRSFGVNASFINRKYDINTLNEDDEFSLENRTWNYINARGFFKIELTKAWTIYPSVTYEKRIDDSDGRFGYNEITPKFYISYTNEKLDTNLSASYSKRNFTDLIVNDNDLLSYDYFRLKLNTDYKLSNHWSLTSQVYVINRKSNNVDLNSVTFRSYENFYAGVGIQFSF